MKVSVFSVAVPEWTTHEAAHTLAEIGYDGVAWRIADQQQSDVPDFWIGNRATWPVMGLEESLPEMLSLATDTGLEISAFYGYPGWSDREAMARQFAAAASIGVKACRIVGPGRKTKSGPRPQLSKKHYDELLAESRNDMAWVAACAREHGVRAIFPLHHEWVASSASAARRLLDDLEPSSVGVIMDVGHLAIEGWEDPLASVQILGAYLDSIMLKNYSWYPARQRCDGSVVWEYRPASLRDGRVDIPNVFAALHAEGFDGWVTVAEGTKTLPQRERLVDALQYVKAAWQATESACRDEWVYEYDRTGSHWSGLEQGESFEKP
jgi:sugar phosphate isomerase/epimerase